MNKLNDVDLNKLKDSLLALNGSLLRLGVNKDEVIILLPNTEWNYINIALQKEKSQYSKYYSKVDDKAFMLGGIKVKKYRGEDLWVGYYLD